MTALAQYFHFLYFPFLAPQKEKILKKIVAFFEEVKDKIPYSSFIIDFAILKKKEVKIIELNPFHFSTGAPLFGWRKGSEDRKILLGKSPFQFRVTEDPETTAIDHYLTEYWATFLTEYTKEDVNQNCVLS